MEIQLKTPDVPADWAYDDSVKKVGQMIYKWKHLTEEIAHELWIAREKLSVSTSDAGKMGAEKKWRGKNVPCHTWDQYCQDIGAEKRTANRWLRKWFPTSAQPIQLPLQEKDICTISDLYGLIDAGKKFGTIYADPPWRYSNLATRASADKHYDTMSLEEIIDLPVEMLTHDQAHLHLWTTNAFLFECPKILEKWGFDYKGVFVWIKPTIGIGNYWRVSHEFLVLGVKGKLRFFDATQKSWLQAPRTKHSAKPEEIVGIIEKTSPGPYLELFGRGERGNWTVWGNEIKKSAFDGGGFDGKEVEI